MNPSVRFYEDALASSETADEVIEKMLARYPGMEHTSALYLGTYLNFKNTHRLLFNPRLEAVAQWLPESFVRWVDAKMLESRQKAANL